MKGLQVLGWWSSLVAGTVLLTACAHEPAPGEAVFAPLPERPLSPTSGHYQPAIGSNAMSSTDSLSPPPGASPDDWALAEVIRNELTKDRRLATAPMEAQVNNGIVTLRGYVPTEKARKRLYERVASLPGVKEVKDELVIKNTIGAWIGRNREF